jgi:hypothetical protein
MERQGRDHSWPFPFSNAHSNRADMRKIFHGIKSRSRA